MIKALIRFLFFLIPTVILRGLGCIILDKIEIVHIDLNWRKIKPKKTKQEEKRNILLEYLKDCHKQEFKEGKNGKT